MERKPCRHTARADRCARPLQTEALSLCLSWSPRRTLPCQSCDNSCSSTIARLVPRRVRRTCRPEPRATHARVLRCACWWRAQRSAAARSCTSESRPSRLARECCRPLIPCAWARIAQAITHAPHAPAAYALASRPHRGSTAACTLPRAVRARRQPPARLATVTDLQAAAIATSALHTGPVRTQARQLERQPARASRRAPRAAAPARARRATCCAWMTTWRCRPGCWRSWWRSWRRRPGPSWQRVG